MSSNDDKWINVDPRTLNLSLRFRVRGFSSQFYISTGLKDTKRNREIVKLRRDAIQADIALGRFDDTLKNYQFHSMCGQTKTMDRKKKNNYDLLELWHKFTNYQEKQIEQTTILNRYASVLRYTKRLPTCLLTDATQIRDWIIDNTTPKMAWILINCYSQCCEWAMKSELIRSNPFEKLKIKHPKKKTIGVDHQAFTLEQRDLIIKAFEVHPKYSYYSSLIKFLFWTGCRPGEAFAIKWGDISADCCKININKSCNAYGILKSTKNGVKRVFSTKPGSKLQAMLLTLKSSAQNHEELLFTDKRGKPLSSEILIGAWKGHGQRFTGVVQELVDNGALPFYLKPYATRHTFVTWAITQGVSPDKVAKLIGDRVETVLKFYCHPQVVDADCPDF